MNRPVEREQLDEETVAILRMMAPYEKLAIGSAIHEEVWQQLATAVRIYHPDWPPERVRRRVAQYLIREWEWSLNGPRRVNVPPGFIEDFTD